MIGFKEAVDEVRRYAHLLDSEAVPVVGSHGRVLSEHLRSPSDLPPFDNAAMDGFAVTCAGQSLPAGTLLPISGERVAGDAQRGAGVGACRIMTGAAIPPGFDSVIPVEQTETVAAAEGVPAQVRLLAHVPHGQHVRLAGEDTAVGSGVMRAGTRIDATSLMLLAALGIGDIEVVRRPRVAIICTGRELVDDPKQPLQSGQIRNSNGPFLDAVLPAMGAEVVFRTTVPDDVPAYLAALDRARDAACDLVLSTGAVSMGSYDFVPAALERWGAKTIFHKVKMRPGKPLLFARVPGGPLYFGLPGNPVSTVTGLRFFVDAALRAMTGRPPEVGVRLPLSGNAHKKRGLTLLQKAYVSIDDTGRAKVELLKGQESFRIRPLLQTNAWALLPEDVEDLEPGAPIEVRDWYDVHPLSWSSAS